MKWIKYSRYTGDDFGIGAEDLLRALSDYLARIGWQSGGDTAKTVPPETRQIP